VKLIYWLAEVEKGDRLLVGDKAYALSHLQQEKYPIINGFVISSSNSKELFKQLKLSFDQTSENLLENPYSLQSFARYCREMILQSDLQSELVSLIAENYPKLQSSYLILRPSLAVTASTRGLLSSLITVDDLAAILVSLKQIWAELFSARSIFYWQKKGISLDQINLAILIQPIESVMASGTVLLENQQAQIQAVLGLGHSLVYGELSPDLYSIDLQTGEISSETRGFQNSAYRLTPENTQHLESYYLPDNKENLALIHPEQIRQLSQYLQRLNNCEFHYQGHLEWTILETEQLYFTQADLNSPESTTHSLRLKGYPASSGRVIAPIEVIWHESHVPKEQTILVFQQIFPHYLPLLTKAVGIIAERGGTTSHAAILARELGIPAVIGVNKATTLLTTGESILLDGNKGEIYRLVGSPVDYEDLRETNTSNQATLSSKEVPLATQLMINVSLVNSPEILNLLPLIDGVGLLRSEIFFAQLWSERPANQWSKEALKERLVSFITYFAELFQQRPVFYRLLDQDAQLVTLHRGTYAYLTDPTLLDLQLEAISEVQKRQNTNISLLLPFVRSVEEFKFCLARVEKIGLREHPSFKLWIMAEVPSILFLLPDYVKAGVEGISLGTNDLTQLLLGFDRQVSHHPPEQNFCPSALQQALKSLIQQAHSCGIPCSICGQAPLQYVDLIDSLIEWGITTISVEPEAVKKVYHAIARAEKRLILQAARKIMHRD